MPPEKNNITVLVAPLDWGLGHATRCIPVIRALMKNGCTVLIATSGHHTKLLQAEFPQQVQFVELAGYGISYSKANMLLRLVLQLPLFFRNIRREYKWLQQTIDTYNIDAVISDNRYGLHSKKRPCVFITHQLQVQAPPFFKWTENGVRKRLYRFIHHFNACWVPDVPDQNNSLGGSLSHPAFMPATPVRYVGWLTRFSPQPLPAKKFKLLISLSGPEPQRTVLEELLMPQLKDVAGKVLLVRGLPGENVGAGLAPAQMVEEMNVTVDPNKPGLVSGSARAGASPAPTNSKNVTIINHLPGAELQAAIAGSEFFMSRCGYSTLMDLQAVACRCIFVPTPGQTEQQYLGRQIAASGKAWVVPQKNIQLQQTLQNAATLPPFSDGSYQNKELETIVMAWANSIRTA